MKRIAVFIFLLFLLVSCIPYDPPVPAEPHGYISTFNRTGHDLLYRYYECGTEAPPFALFNDSLQKGARWISSEVTMRLDVILVTPERLIADGSAVYTGREKIAEGSFDFQVENKTHVDLTITFTDETINYEITQEDSK